MVARDAVTSSSADGVEDEADDERPEDGDDDRGDEALDLAEAHLLVASQPPMTPPMIPTTMLGRQPRAVLPPTQRARDRARR